MKNLLAIIVLFTLIKCSGQSKHCPWKKCCACDIEIQLSDSLQLKHIKGDFYENESGHLYHKTISVTPHREITYFDGTVSQDLDPYTFKHEGFYAKDKNSVFTYRPRSGGIQIFKIDEADLETFEEMDGCFCAKDKNHFYNESEIIEGFVPGKAKIITDKEGKLKLTQGSSEFTF